MRQRYNIVSQEHTSYHASNTIFQSDIPLDFPLQFNRLLLQLEILVSAFLSNRSEEKRNLLPQLVAVRKAHGPDTCGVSHRLFHSGIPSLVGLPVSETSSEEACEGRDTTEVAVVKTTIGGDGVSPHQIPHTEIDRKSVV